MTEYHVRSRPGGTTVRVSRPGGVTRVRTRLAGGSAGGAGLTGDSEIVADSTTLTGPPHTIAVAAAGSIDITVTLPDATVDDKGLVWYIRNLNSDSVVYVANLAEGDETITESKGLLVAGIETDTPGTYTWMKVGFVSETAAAGGGADLSDATPQALGTAAAGTGTAAARDDHVHAMPTAADVGAAATSHNHAGSDITSGTLDIARIPTGTTSTTVPLGNDSRITGAVQSTRTVNGHALSADVTITASDVGAQPSDADLTTIAGLTATTDSFLQAKSSAWAARTVAEVKTDLGIADRNYYIDNEWYLLSHNNDKLGGYAGCTPGTNAMAFWLIVVERTIQIDGCWFYLQATGTSAKMRPGIWAASNTTGKPTGNPLVSAAEVDVSGSTGYKSQTFTPVTVTPGVYWGGIACVGTATYRTWAATSGTPPVDMGGPDSAATVHWSFNSPWTYSSSALPDVSGFTYTAQSGTIAPSTGAPHVRWRVQIP